MILLFLDDERNFEDVTWMKYPFKFDRVVTFRNPRLFAMAADFYLRHTTEEISVSLDHDLQYFMGDGEEITGYSIYHSLVEDWILDDIAIPRFVFAHTQNPVGREAIRSYHQHSLRFQYEQTIHDINRAYGV